MGHDALERAAQRVLEVAADFKQATDEASSALELTNIVAVLTSACLTLTTQLEQSSIALKWKQSADQVRRG